MEEVKFFINCLTASLCDLLSLSESSASSMSNALPTDLSTLFESPTCQVGGPEEQVRYLGPV